MAQAAFGTPGGVGYVNPFAATALPNNGGAAPAVNPNASMQTPGTMGGSATVAPAVSAGYSYPASTGGGSSAPASTTLAQDQAKAANQGMPGYDTLGNPIPGYTQAGLAPGSLPNTTAGPDTAFSQAKSNLQPTAPQTEEEFYSQIQSQLQPVIDKISAAEMAAETAANVKATQATSAMNFGANARGLAGSSEADAQAGQITQQRGADVAAALQTQATALSSLAQFAIPEAHAMYQDAITRSDAQSQAYIAQQQNMMGQSLAGLAASGLSLTDLQTSNPVQYQQLLQYAGGDANALNAIYLSAAMKNQSLLNNGQPLSTQGNNLVYGVQTLDPKTGKPTISTTTVTLPTLPNGYKVTSYNQSANGAVAYIAFPTDSFGNQTIDPSKPNNGVVSSIIGGEAGAGSQSTVPDPNSTAITAQTGLSINAFNFATQGTSALSRMNQSARAQVQQEAQTWANDNGIDLSTFQSQYKANNETLASNISRFNNTKVAEGEVTGTLDNMNTQAIDSGLGSVNIVNVGKILAGQQVNDPKANAYSFYFNDLKNSLAYFYAAQQGKSSPDIIDNEDAAQVIVGGLSSGGVSGLQDAVTATTNKMSTVLQSAVTSAKQNIWDLFGVGQNYASSHASQPQSNTESSTSTGIYSSDPQANW